jgi:hypothetical protein
MKILFLDFDGVLMLPNQNKFNINAINNLRDILAKTNCKIVLSSSWRISDRYIDDIKQANPDSDLNWVSNIIDVTPDLFPLSRVDEINHWLSLNPVDGYAIVDDLKLKTDNFVKTNPRLGLDSKIKDKLIFTLVAKCLA